MFVRLYVACSSSVLLFLCLEVNVRFSKVVLRSLPFLKGPCGTLILTDFSFRSPLWYIAPTKYFHTVNTGIYMPCLSNNFIFFKHFKSLWIAKQDQYVTAEWAREITAVAM